MGLFLPQVPTEYVLRRFNNEGCPALKGKPKFFILQACRGDDADFGTIPTLGKGSSINYVAVFFRILIPPPPFVDHFTL